MKEFVKNILLNYIHCIGGVANWRSRYHFKTYVGDSMFFKFGLWVIVNTSPPYVSRMYKAV